MEVLGGHEEATHAQGCAKTVENGNQRGTLCCQVMIKCVCIFDLCTEELRVEMVATLVI